MPFAFRLAAFLKGEHDSILLLPHKHLWQSAHFFCCRKCFPAQLQDALHSKDVFWVTGSR